MLEFRVSAACINMANDSLSGPDKPRSFSCPATVNTSALHRPLVSRPIALEGPEIKPLLRRVVAELLQQMTIATVVSDPKGFCAFPANLH